MKRKRVVITGMGVVSCFGNDVEHFYEQLLAGKSGVSSIETFPCQEYPTRFAGVIRQFEAGEYLDKKQARRVDPFISYAIVAGKKALERAGLNSDELQKLNKSRCGVLIGSGMGGMNVFYEGVQTMLTKGYKRLTPFFVPFIITNMAGALLAIDLGFTGPNYSISTACATANYCIYNAAEHIRQGAADLIICGGSESPINPVGLSGFVAIKALSENNDAPELASRPWDKKRDGFVMGEGAGVLVLESLEHAQARGATILAEYLGGAISCDAHHMTDPRHDGSVVAECIRSAINDAGITKEEINYINAHATSTPVGDLCEIHAIKNVFNDGLYKNIKMNATKSLIGHCLGAAGGMAAIVVIQSILKGMLHPNCNLIEPEEEVQDMDLVPSEAIRHDVRVAMANSFGFGGHNSSLLIAPFKG